MKSKTPIPRAAMKNLWLKSRNKTARSIRDAPFHQEEQTDNQAPDQMVDATVKAPAQAVYQAGKKLAQNTAHKLKERRKAARTAQAVRKNAFAGNSSPPAGEPASAPKEAPTTSPNGSVRERQSLRAVSPTSLEDLTPGKATVHTPSRPGANPPRQGADAVASSPKKPGNTGLGKAGQRIPRQPKVPKWEGKPTLAGAKSPRFVGKSVKASQPSFRITESAAQSVTQGSVRKGSAMGRRARAVWKEVLAVYAVKTTTDPQGQDVASMDEKKLGLLAEVFWEMNQISAKVETRMETAESEYGTAVEAEITVLVITVSHKTAWEMAELLHFDKNQREQLRELLSEEYDGLWNELLYGIAGGSGDLVAVALSQVGQVGGEPYWSWYGFGSRVEWCACFVSWCADQCGLLDSGAVPKFAGVGTGVQWFQSRGQWLDGSATPEPGMIIFFKWYGSDSLIADHVGIVERVEDGRIYTIEGNSDNMVRQNSYPVGYGEILGYGVVAL